MMPRALPCLLGSGPAYRHDMDPQDQAALWSWLGFTGTFAVVRGITYSIRAGIGPFGNINAGGAHLHHYLWGIGMVSGVGAVDGLAAGGAKLLLERSHHRDQENHTSDGGQYDAADVNAFAAIWTFRSQIFATQ